VQTAILHSAGNHTITRERSRGVGEVSDATTTSNAMQLGNS